MRATTQVFGEELVPGETATLTFPFRSFSDLWDPATGDIITECEDNEEYCLTDEILQNIETTSIWGEGVGGSVHLEIEEIGATGCVPAADEGEMVTLANLATFDGADPLATHDFYALNDPVMGGQSTS